jgi:hypothetical protein
MCCLSTQRTLKRLNTTGLGRNQINYLNFHQGHNWVKLALSLFLCGWHGECDCWYSVGPCQAKVPHSCPVVPPVLHRWHHERQTCVRINTNMALALWILQEVLGSTVPQTTTWEPLILRKLWVVEMLGTGNISSNQPLSSVLDVTVSLKTQNSVVYRNPSDRTIASPAVLRGTCSYQCLSLFCMHSPLYLYFTV